MCTLHLSEPLFNMPCAKCNAMLKLHLRNTGSPFAICNVLYRLMCNVHLLSGQSAVSSMSTWLRDFESCNAMLNVPSQISRHICCRLRLSITCCALHNVQGSLRWCKCASPCLSGHLALLCLLFQTLKALESSHVTQKHICESSHLTWTHIWRLLILLIFKYSPSTYFAAFYPTSSCKQGKCRWWWTLRGRSWSVPSAWRWWCPRPGSGSARWDFLL